MTDTLALVGANPAVTLFDGDEPMAFASLWRVDWSPHGSGTAIVLWHAGRVRVFGSDPAISRTVEGDFTRYFPEVQQLAWSAPEFVVSPVVMRSSLTTGAVAQAQGIEVVISGLMDRRIFATADFPLAPDTETSDCASCWHRPPTPGSSSTECRCLDGLGPAAPSSAPPPPRSSRMPRCGLARRGCRLIHP